MDRLGRWLGKNKPERSSRVTRFTASPSATRVSYSEEIVPLELLDASPAKAMAFPCRDFMADADIQEEFDALCANADLTCLVTSRVQQYETLTAIFVNNFRFYPESDSVVFQIYERLLTMPMSIFCEALGLPDIGEKRRKNSQTAALNTILDSFCNTEVRSSNRQNISNILFPHLRYFAYYIARGVLARDNTSSTSMPDTAKSLATNGNKGDLFGGVYA